MKDPTCFGCFHKLEVPFWGSYVRDPRTFVGCFHKLEVLSWVLL